MKNILFLLSCIVVLQACKPTTSGKSYDTAAALKNVSENIILPNYEQLYNREAEMQLAIMNFSNSPSTTNLKDAKEKFLIAYTAWQKCSMFQFGPAEDEALHTINVFPTDTSKIGNNISVGTYDLEQASNITASGFPALDYLLFHANDADIVAAMANQNYRKYLGAVTQQILDKTLKVKTSWNNSYKESFLSSTGKDAGSSISLLTNAMVLNFEKNGREAKIGIPAGVRTLNQVIPEKVEAYYSGHSIALAKEHMAALKELYKGKNGASFQSILIDLDKKDLAENIEKHFGEIETTLNALSDPFSDALASSNQGALDAYAAYQKLLPMLKVDMTSALGILITYSDSDGD